MSCSSRAFFAANTRRSDVAAMYRFGTKQKPKWTQVTGQRFPRWRNRGELSPNNPRVPNLAYPVLTSSSEGRFSRRREAGRGAVPLAGLAYSKSSTRGGAGLPPGPLRDPARSWLTTLGSVPIAGDRLSCLWMRRAEPPTGQRIAAGHLRRKRGRRRITPQVLMLRYRFAT
jgi:hypothetical protein